MLTNICRCFKKKHKARAQPLGIDYLEDVMLGQMGMTRRQSASRGSVSAKNADDRSTYGVTSAPASVKQSRRLPGLAAGNLGTANARL